MVPIAGHTHEDADQMFSVISHALSSKFAILRTPSELQQFLSSEVYNADVSNVNDGSLVITSF